MKERVFDTLFTQDKPIVFAYDGYPWLIHRLAYRRTNHRNLHVRGDKEEGTISTPFDMTVMIHPKSELPEIFLARHGETEWTITGQHTGQSEIPLTDRGERNARRLGERLVGKTFTQVFTSPRMRAQQTCALAGFGDRAEVEPDLAEWDYGRYEGARTADIRRERPDWFLFRDGCPEGESVAEVGARADRLIGRLRAIEGRVLLFGHGHFFRVLTARWLGLPPGDGRLFMLSVASLSILGYEHSREEPAIRLWNDDRHVGD